MKSLVVRSIMKATPSSQAPRITPVVSGNADQPALSLSPFVKKLFYLSEFAFLWGGICFSSLSLWGYFRR